MESTIRSICQNLVSNDQAVRKKAIKNVNELFKKNNTIDDLSLYKICKGLYYCLWMTHDPIQVNKLSLEIIQLYKSFKSTKTKNNGKTAELDTNEIDIRLRYIKTLMDTVSREWPLLDKNRIDKVLLFTRILVSEILYYMNELKWDLAVLNKLSEIYVGVFTNDNLGLLLHFIQIYINELVMNYKHLSDTSVNGVGKKNVNNFNTNKNSEMNGLQLFYVLKPFLVMFVNSKDKLILTTIYNYVFRELQKLNQITNISLVVYFLNYLLDSNSLQYANNVGNHLNGTAQTLTVQGLNKKFIKNSLKLYESNLKSELTEQDKSHFEEMVQSFLQTQSLDHSNADDDHTPEDNVMDATFENGNEDYINLSNLTLRRMTKKRLRYLFILNNTKRYMLLIRPNDDESVKIMNKLNQPKVLNQLFYFSLIRLKRLKLQYRFKHAQLNKIYNFNKDRKSKFNINLQQALDNIKNIKPLKSSLAKKSKSADSGSLASSKKTKKK